MRKIINSRITGALFAVGATLALAAGTAACGSSSSGGQASGSSSTSQAPSSAPATSPASASPAASCPSGAWQTGPVSVTHQVAVPPVPVATAITTGSHPECKFDRLVISFNGPLPGYDAAFVSQVIGDASGQPITVPGNRYLVLRLRPAQGHTDTGTSTLSPHAGAVGYPMLKGYAVSGDFEAVLSIALGLDGGTKYRIGELPGRIYVDVSW